MLLIVFNFTPANFCAVLQYYVSYRCSKYDVTHEQLTLKNSYMLRRISDTQRGQQLEPACASGIKVGRVEESIVVTVVTSNKW